MRVSELVHLCGVSLFDFPYHFVQVNCKKNQKVPFNLFISCNEALETIKITFSAVLRIRIRIHRIHVFLGLQDPDPDPPARGRDPDQDPSIIMQK